MPIYEFKCSACGRRFEKLCSMGESGDNLSCSGCGATGPSRVMSGFTAKSSGKDFLAGPAGGGCGGCSSTNCNSCGH